MSVRNGHGHPGEGRSRHDRRLRVAIAGTRGVPATYGGFETFAEELGARLVARGHDVTVYGRSHVVPSGLTGYRGMAIRTLPTVTHKYFDTVIHTAVSMVDLLPRGFDVALICNSANAPFALLPRIVGTKVVLNVDGLEWHRKKWGRIGRTYYMLCAWLASKLPIALVSDARVVAEWYRAQHARSSVYIPYGSDGRTLPPGETLERLGLRPGQYVLYVSRLEPENNAHVVIDAHTAARIDTPLVVVGDAPYASSYKRALRRMADANDRVLLAGAIYGEGYVELQSNAALYIQATEVGGTHPALVEAMARGACIVANDVPEHHEVLGDAGAYYARNDASALGQQMTRLLANEGARAALGAKARDRALATYSWERVADLYEALFHRLVDARGRLR